jgi:hypothetical protein
MEIYHVYPLNDLHPHSLNGDGSHCECITRSETMPNGNVVVVHSAFDGREIIEEAEAIKNEVEKTL